METGVSCDHHEPAIGRSSHLKIKLGKEISQAPLAQTGTGKCRRGVTELPLDCLIWRSYKGSWGYVAGGTHLTQI